MYFWRPQQQCRTLWKNVKFSFTEKKFQSDFYEKFTLHNSNLITILLSRNIFNGCWWSVSIIFIYVVRSCLISCNTFYQNSFQDSNPVKFSLFFTVSFSRNKWMTFEKFHEFAKTWVKKITSWFRLILIIFLQPISHKYFVYFVYLIWIPKVFGYHTLIKS